MGWGRQYLMSKPFSVIPCSSPGFGYSKPSKYFIKVDIITLNLTSQRQPVSEPKDLCHESFSFVAITLHAQFHLNFPKKKKTVLAPALALRENDRFILHFIVKVIFLSNGGNIQSREI